MHMLPAPNNRILIFLQYDRLDDIECKTDP